MRIVFVATEEDERDYFVRSLSSHNVVFVRSLDQVKDDAEIVSVFVNTKVDENFFVRCPKVRLIASRSSSVDHLDIAAAKKHGVTLVHVPDYGAATVAEHTFALILGVTRKLKHCLSSIRHGKKTSEELRGRELCGKTLGVVGTGRVGRQVIRIAHGFGMRCLAMDESRDEDLGRELGFSYAPLEEILEQSDVITLHVPLNRKTRGMLDAKRLAACKRGVILINTARGALVEIDALLEGLESGHIGGVGLDVLEGEEVTGDDMAEKIGAQIVQKMHSVSTPGGDSTWYEGRLEELRGIMKNRQLLAHENVFYTPHVGYNSIEAVERICVGTVENIRNFISGKISKEVVVKL